MRFGLKIDAKPNWHWKPSSTRLLCPRLSHSFRPEKIERQSQNVLYIYALKANQIFSSSLLVQSVGKKFELDGDKPHCHCSTVSERFRVERKMNETNGGIGTSNSLHSNRWLKDFRSPNNNKKRRSHEVSLLKAFFSAAAGVVVAVVVALNSALR